MAELDFEQLVKLAENPQTKETAMSVNDIIKNLDGFLKQGDQIVNFIEKLEQRPSISLLIRQAADKNKLSLEPLSKPIQTVEVGVKASSPTHEEMYKELNKIPEEQLKEMIKQMQGKKDDGIHTESGKPKDK